MCKPPPAPRAKLPRSLLTGPRGQPIFLGFDPAPSGKDQRQKCRLIAGFLGLWTAPGSGPKGSSSGEKSKFIHRTFAREAQGHKEGAGWGNQEGIG